MTARKAFTPVELRELAKEPYDFHHPHLLDALRSALLFCADVIDAANEALRQPGAAASPAPGRAPLHDYADAIVRDAIDRKHLERTDKDSLTVAAWRVEFDRRDNAVELWPAEAHGHPPGFGNEVEALVRLTDAESALKARDAEIERLRGAIDGHNAECIRQCEARKAMGSTHCPMKGYRRNCSDCPRDGMVDEILPWMEQEAKYDAEMRAVAPDAAIDQARATGGEKANG